MWESKRLLTRLHTTRHDSTELFKIFFSLLTLQLLFCKKLVGREKIIDTECYCISDHFAITFKIKQSVIRKPRVKRTCFNYRDAHWIDLNNDLNNIDWDMIIDCYEPEIMWSNF